MAVPWIRGLLVTLEKRSNSLRVSLSIRPECIPTEEELTKMFVLHKMRCGRLWMAALWWESQ